MNIRRLHFIEIIIEVMRNLFQKHAVFVQAIAQLAVDGLQPPPAEVGTDRIQDAARKRALS